MFRDVREIPLLGEMSQSDKSVAVFAEKPSPTNLVQTFVLLSHTKYKYNVLFTAVSAVVI